MATYYIDATGGLDSNTGLEGFPWQTLEKVNQTTFTAGDSILFKRGETWRGMIDVDDSGTTAARITYGAYGTGDKPKLKGSILADEAFIVPVSGDLGDDNFQAMSPDMTFWDTVSANVVVDSWANFPVDGPGGGSTYGVQTDDGAASRLLYESDTPYTNLWVEFDTLAPADFDTDRDYIFAIYDEDGTQTHTLRWYTDGKFRFFKDGLVGANSAVTKLGNVWYNVKIQMITDNTNASGRGLTRIWVDNSLVLTVDKSVSSSNEGVGGLSNYKKIGGFSIGNDGSPSGSFQYFDNVRYSRSNFDVGVGLWTQGVYPFSHDALDDHLKMWVDGVAFTGPETVMGAVDAAGEFIMGDGSPIANTDFNYYWYSDYSSQTVELPFQYWNGVSSYFADILSIIDKNNITFDSLDVSQSRLNGVSVSGTSGEAKGNTAKNCDISEAIYAGVEIVKNTKDFLITDCNVNGCEHSGLYTNLEDGSGNFPTNIKILDNKFKDNALEGIYLEKIDTATIEGNIIAATVADATGTWGRALMLGLANGVDRVVGRISVNHNTIDGAVDDTLTLNDAGDGEAIIDFHSNIVIQDNPGKLTATSPLSETSEVLQMDYNCFWHSLSDTEIVWDFSDADYNRTELDGYQANHGEHSLFVDPQLDADFRPTNPLVMIGGKPVNGLPTSMGAIGASGSAGGYGTLFNTLF